MSILRETRLEVSRSHLSIGSSAEISKKYEYYWKNTGLKGVLFIKDNKKIEIKSAGSRIGKYEIKRILGQGGCGTVYLAEDVVLRKKWAMKQISRVSTFKIEEALVMRELDHPGIPRITEQIEDESCIYIVMDYCPGESLRKYCSQNRISVDEIIDWGIQLCDILTYLHAQNPPVIFRDMKPDNIIRGENGRLKLIDFGIAKTQLEKDARGTRGFAAPEQYKGVYSVRSDIYNLGASLLWCMKSMHFTPLKRILKKAASERVSKRYKSSEQFRKKLLKLQKKRKNEKVRIRIWIVLGILQISILAAVRIAAGLEKSEKDTLAWDSYNDAIRAKIEESYEKGRETYEQGLQKKRELLEGYLGMELE